MTAQQIINSYAIKANPKQMALTSTLIRACILDILENAIPELADVEADINGADALDAIIEIYSGLGGRIDFAPRVD